MHSLNQATLICFSPLCKRVSKQVMYCLYLNMNMAFGNFCLSKNTFSGLKIENFHTWDPPLFQFTDYLANRSKRK